MTRMLYGDRAVALMDTWGPRIASDPVFCNKQAYTASRCEQYHSSMKRAERLEQLRQEYQLDACDYETVLVDVIGYDALGNMLHETMFLPHLKTMFRGDQLHHWLPRTERSEVIGCFAQTEMGHGSNVSALETTATYLPETDEFDVHSPTLTSTKWWIGGLGCTANTAMVVARLRIGDTDHGIHSFLVPIRSPRDHVLLPGVHAGDIGPKLGWDLQDNGFLRLTHVRIPRTYMAMRFSAVDATGTFSQPSSDFVKIGYLTSVSMRVRCLKAAANALSRAVTIAVRYSAVRRQGGVEQAPILDYSQQQYRLLPLIATAYAIHFTAGATQRLFNEVTTRLQHGVPLGRILAETHATSSGLKALTTQTTADGIEECRKACGGHGYLLSSGLPSLSTTYVKHCTIEGDNYVISHQTTRYLLKLLETTAQVETMDMVGMVAPLEGPAGYLNRPRWNLASKCTAMSVEEIMVPSTLLDLYAHRALWLLDRTARALHDATASGLHHPASFVATESHAAARAHCAYVLLYHFHRAVTTAPQPLQAVLLRLLQLFALHGCERDIGAFLEDGYLSATQAGHVREAVRTLLSQIRPDAVALVDAFHHHDHRLNSTLGRYDGEVYPALMEAAQRESLNARL
jgi:acyl-CoA oxidase